MNNANSSGGMSLIVSSDGLENSFYMDVLELLRSSDEEIRDDLREADSLRICGVHQDRVS